MRKKRKRLGYKNIHDVKEHPYFKDISWYQIENMTMNSPFVFDSEDNFDDSYVQQQENDSIYEGNKELYIFEVNESKLFKNFYFNIEDKYMKKSEEKQKTQKETKTKTNFTSKTSNRKIGDDSEIVIHTVRNKSDKKKTAVFKGILPDSDNKVIKIMRKNSKPGNIKINLDKFHDDSI